ncbi:MAG: phenylalanine--tRNA ligase subunit beta, partial [Chloroflexota bacterium]
LRATPVVVAQISIAGLSAGHLADPFGATPSRHPLVERDLAVVVAESTPAGAVAEAIRTHGGDLLRSVTLFDIYRGRPLEDAEKSLAYRLAFQAQERTLTEAEVDEAVDRVREGIGRDVGGRIRT